jgi:hypothetical protein
MDTIFFKLGACQTAKEAAVIGSLVAAAATSGVDAARQEALVSASRCGANAQHVRGLACVLADLISHGWRLEVIGKDILAYNKIEPAQDAGRDYVRQIQLGQREQQLRKPAVREFVRSMERKRLGPTGWISVFSLMRDGKELASALCSTGIASALVPSVIDPYIQVIEDAERQRCAFTGLRLMDIWRYFRYTWAMPYNSVPGRSMLVLIRDAAMQNHPVIGIAALGSAIVQLAQRDTWIGWTSADFVRQVQQQPTQSIARWIPQRLERLVAALYTADLYRDGVLSRRELKNPTDSTFSNLRAEAALQWKLHRKFPHRDKHKAQTYDEKYWKRETVSHLFRAKRCETLALLLQAQKALNDSEFRPTVASLRFLASSGAGRRAIEILLRGAKAEHIGIDMLDITICGAVPPYNPILGGKLVAMLLCSPEIVRAYAKRYKDTPSVIASSMAGRSVHRQPRLALLCTTSLYGERLNQYHRVQIPKGMAGAKDAIRYVYLGESVGFGSSHLCRETVAELELLISQSSQGRRVNSIFGEGVSPRLRKVRDGLDQLGLPSDIVLNHGNRRLLYGIPLASNFRELLMGLAKTPKYILPQNRRKLVTECIAQFWGKRWLSSRLANHPEIIDAVAANDLRIPDRHAARVQLPEIITETLPLFA